MGTYLPCLIDMEKEILIQYSNQIKARSNPIIAIGGFSGTGKDTIAKFVQQFYKEKRGINLEIISAGDVVRQIAKDSGYNERDLEQFTFKIQKNQEFSLKVDIEIENHTLKTALLNGGIFIGRMTPFVIGDWGITIWLEVSAQMIAKRVTRDKTRAEFGLNEESVKEKIRLRDSTDGKRLESTYEISFREAITKFNFVLRNEGLSKTELQQKTFSFLDKHYKSNF